VTVNETTQTESAAEPNSRGGHDDTVESAGVPVDHEIAVELDLDAIEHDLDGVEAALQRLDDGSYWTDEVTGEPIPDATLTADPTARRGG
jgi:RNA polymerase-binding transcription factor DksA